jgi:hypothetical protein
LEERDTRRRRRPNGEEKGDNRGNCNGSVNTEKAETAETAGRLFEVFEEQSCRFCRFRLFRRAAAFRAPTASL